MTSTFETEAKVRNTLQIGLTAVLTLLCGILIFLFQFQSNKLWDQGQDIASIKAGQANQVATNERIEKALEAMGNQLILVLTGLDGVKDGVTADSVATGGLKADFDDGKRELKELQKRLEEVEQIIAPLKGKAN